MTRGELASDGVLAAVDDALTCDGGGTGEADLTVLVEIDMALLIVAMA